jgi:hypothetical protein
MVEVGPGDDPGDVWWVVATRGYSDAWGVRGEYNPPSYLTTTPSGVDAVKWIYVGRALQAPAGSTDWSAVSWTGERLERGKAAQAAAQACLEGAR